MKFDIRFAIIFFLSLAGIFPASATMESEPVSSAHVTARLVAPSENIRAREPFTILLCMEMDEGWHTCQ